MCVVLFARSAFGRCHWTAVLTVNEAQFLSAKMSRRVTLSARRIAASNTIGLLGKSSVDHQNAALKILAMAVFNAMRPTCSSQGQPDMVLSEGKLVYDKKYK